MMGNSIFATGNLSFTEGNLDSPSSPFQLWECSRYEMSNITFRHVRVAYKAVYILKEFHCFHFEFNNFYLKLVHQV